MDTVALAQPAGDGGAHQSNSFASNFVDAFDYSLVQQSYDGFSQLVNHVTGTKLIADRQLVEKPADPQNEAAKLGQGAGELVAGAVKFLPLYRFMGSGSVAKLELTSEFGLTAKALPDILKSAGAGAALGMALDPVPEDDHFWRHKFADAGSIAATGAFLTASALKLKSGGAALWQNDAVLGVATGFPAGVVGANAKSIIERDEFASLSDDLSAGLTMSAAGGLMGGVNLLHERWHPTSEIPGIRSLRQITEMNDASVRVLGEPKPYYHVMREVDGPDEIKDLLNGKLTFLPPASRDHVASPAADLTATHEATKMLGPKVAFYVSARIKENTFAYQRLRMLARGLSEDGWTIVNGGGPAGMAASSRGAFEAGGDPVGIRVNLPFEEDPNKWISIATLHKHVFSRMEALAKIPDAYIVDKPGWGTVAEGSNVLQLMQLRHMPEKPTYLTDRPFWSMFDRIFRKQAREGLIKPRDLDLYKVTGNIKQIREELRAYKKNVLDPLYEQLHKENAPYAAEALPRRYRRAPVTQRADGSFDFGQFLEMTPDEFRKIKPVDESQSR